MNVSLRAIKKNSEIRKYKQFYVNEYMIQQPTDSSDQNWANLNTAYGGQTDKCGTAIRI
jgi:hypothetical protein